MTAAAAIHAFLEDMGMIKSGLGATIAVLVVSIVVSGILHVALTQHRIQANAAISGEITSSIPR
ncbi:hypothetical protein NXT3_CH00551 [Sinorhizobium fredii]|uniref:Uncharacterized protein n=2 Tax=Sinorhizobium TaxID=28105 RepID=A0A2L0H152_RHIFR|nr:hypothetical protein NXT3_CH00551 [Sinorhizobium fredii]